MNESVFTAKELAEKLGKHRTSTVENELSRVFRKLSEQQQSEIISDLLNNNVRAAAAVAARGGISVRQQRQLFQLLLESGQTNALKVMVHDVFANRMSADVFFRILEKNGFLHPEGVHLAAYYFLGSGTMNERSRSALRSLFQATKPKV
jgi:hypothetical protein